MTDRYDESGVELVLDNRKVIIAFAVLIALCGCFFVLGFIEGKRQGFQAGSLSTAQSAPKAGTDDLQMQPAGLSDQGAKPLKSGEGEQRLDWYKSINRREGAPEGVLPAQGSSSTSKPAASDSANKSKGAAVPAKSLTYSVQVGAFSQRQEADTKAKALRSKGYDARVEPPHPPEQLYLLKVGTFKSRADAVAMQSRLKKNGIHSFVKTN